MQNRTRKPSKLNLQGRAILKYDPTRTAGLRRAFIADIRRRLARISRKLIELVEREDAFGLSRKRMNIFATNADKIKYACVLAPIEDPHIKRAVAQLQAKLNPNDVVELETKPHVTVRYGLLSDNPITAYTMLYLSGMILVRFGRLSVFNTPEADVLKVEVITDDIKELNRQLAMLPHVDTYREYVPHLTIAYLKPGTGHKYTHLSCVQDQSCFIKQLVFSDAERNHSTIALNVFCPTGAGGGVDPTCSPSGITAGRIEQLAKMTKDELQANPPNGLQYRENLGSRDVIARWNDASSEVWLGASYFEHSEEDRKDILAHEIGHGLVARLTHDVKASQEEFFPLVESGLLGKWNDEKGRFIGLGGQRNPDEVLADLAKDVLMRPEQVEKRYPRQVAIVKKIMAGKKIVKEDWTTNVFCPTGPGGGQDNSCGPTKGVKVETYINSEWGTPQFIFKTEAGKEIGELQLKLRKRGSKDMVAANLIVWPEFQRKGHATEFYRHAAAWVEAKGGKLYLSKDRTDDAKALHKSFKEKGFLDDNDRISFSPTTNTRWKFQSSGQQQEAFRQWLIKQMQEEFLSDPTTSQDDWWDRYIYRSFMQGAGRIFDDVRKPSLKKDMGWYNGTREEFLRSAFAQPIHRDKVKLLSGRVLTELKGFTDDLARRTMRQLTDGLTRGDSPREVARKLTKEVGLSASRAETIARTETIRAHAEGQLMSIERLGIEEFGVQVEWSVSGLGVTKKGNLSPCPLCAEMNGVVLTLQEAKGLIPRHPNCMCSFIPSGVDEDPNQIKTRKGIEQAIRRSVQAESPKRDIEEQLKRTRWAGADTKIATQRPVSIMDDAWEPTVTNVFCPTGEGGGVDPTCSPGGSGPSLKEALTSDAPGMGRQAALLQMASKIEVTQERVVGEDIGSRDYDAIEGAMSDEERDAMSERLEDMRTSYLDSYMDDYDPEVEVDQSDYMREDENGEQVLDQEAYDEAVQDAEQRDMEDRLSYLESEYDDSGDRREYLREFWNDNRERFEGGSLRKNMWGLDGDGDDAYTFEVGGQEFQASVWSKFKAQDVNIKEFAFHNESKNSYGVTGTFKEEASKAREVFTQISSAAVAYLSKTDTPALYFSAAEPSRQKLYDRLVKTVSKVLPQYSAFAATTQGGNRSYVIALRGDTMDKIKAEAEKRLGTSDLDVLVNRRIQWRQVQPVIYLSWFEDRSW